MTSSSLNTSDVLRMIASLKAWTLRTERIQAQLEQELAVTQDNLMHATNEIQEAAKLTDALYEVCQTLGLVADHLIRQKGIDEGNQSSESFEVILNAVVKQLDSKKVNRGIARSASGISSPFELNSQDQARQGPAGNAFEM